MTVGGLAFAAIVQGLSRISLEGHILGPEGTWICATPDGMKSYMGTLPK